jgi:hypothetical protein
VAELASQVGDGSEDATRDDVAFDLGEPEFDLVEPGGVGGGEVKPDSAGGIRGPTVSCERRGCPG